MTAETSNAREWVLVPRELTPEMREAWEKAPCRLASEWAALLAAAPPPAAARGDVRGLVAKWRDSARNAKRYSTTDYEDGYAAAENACAAELEAALAAEGVQAGEVEQRARELLAAEYAKDERYGMAYAARNGSNDVMPAIRAIVAALSQQPEARGVVDEAMVERACRAHDPMYDHVGNDTRADMRERMRTALTAALTEARNVR